MIERNMCNAVMRGIGLVLELDDVSRDALRQTYARLAHALPNLKIMLTSYFGGLGGNLDTALALPVAGLHIDLVRAPQQLDEVVAKASRDLVLSFGVIDGRNIWRSDLSPLIDQLAPIVATAVISVRVFIDATGTMSCPKNSWCRNSGPRQPK